MFDSARAARRPRRGHRLFADSESAASGSCVVCQSPGHGTCSWCLVVNYCSPECQRRDWFLRHRRICTASQASKLSIDAESGTSVCGEQDSRDNVLERVSVLKYLATSFASSIKDASFTSNASHAEVKRVVSDPCLDEATLDAAGVAAPTCPDAMYIRPGGYIASSPLAEVGLNTPCNSAPAHTLAESWAETSSHQGRRDTIDPALVEQACCQDAKARGTADEEILADAEVAVDSSQLAHSLIVSSTARTAIRNSGGEPTLAEVVDRQNHSAAAVDAASSRCHLDMQQLEGPLAKSDEFSYPSRSRADLSSDQEHVEDSATCHGLQAERILTCSEAKPQPTRHAEVPSAARSGLEVKSCQLESVASGELAPAAGVVESEYLSAPANLQCQDAFANEVMPRTVQTASEEVAHPEQGSANQNAFRTDVDQNINHVVPPHVGEQRVEAADRPTTEALQLSVTRWREKVDRIINEDVSDGDDEVEEFSDLAELINLLEQEDLVPRCEVTVEGVRPILVTAPHCIALLRDGWEPHLVEEYTAQVARGLAKKLSGSSLMWTSTEQRRVELLMSLGRKRCSLGSDLLDPRNRDPNHLLTSEVSNNEWFKLMLDTTMAWREDLGQTVPTLHVDVHGCKDPPATPSHLTVGLGAMMRKAEGSGKPRKIARVQQFGKLLERKLDQVLSSVPLQPRALSVRVIVPDGKAAQSNHTRFAGAWALDTRRHTQTQQAVAFAGFEHAVQLEMSKALRRVFLQRPAALDQFGYALHSAWDNAKRST